MITSYYSINLINFYSLLIYSTPGIGLEVDRYLNYRCFLRKQTTVAGLADAALDMNQTYIGFDI